MNLIKSIVEHNLAIFNVSRFNYYVFYKTYDLALQHLKHTEGFEIDKNRELERLKHYSYYYYGALKKAIEITERKKDEPITVFNKRVQKAYYDLRKLSFLFLQQRIHQDYGVIYQVLGKETPLDIKREKSFAGDNVIGVSAGDY